MKACPVSRRSKLRSPGFKKTLLNNLHHQNTPDMKLSRITEFNCHGYTVTRDDGLTIEVLRSYPNQWFVYTSLNGVGGTHHTNGLRQDVPYNEALRQAKAIFNSK
jgi:hypothetical protein